MNFQDVRNALDKGVIVVSEGRLSAFYVTRDGRWANQPIANDSTYKDFAHSKTVFETLLKNADRFELHFFPEGQMRMDFIVSGVGGGGKACLLEPVTIDKTIPELKRMLFERILPGMEDRLEELNGFFSGDPDGVDAVLGSWSAEEEAETPVSEERSERWETMLALSESLACCLPGFETEILEPDDETGSGSVEFQADISEQTDLIFAGSDKELLLRAVSCASLVNFEAGYDRDPSVTLVDITFYS